MKNRAVVGGLATLVVVGLVVAGLFAIGSPATARKYKADSERRNRISQLHYVLASHVRSEGDLPADLDDVDEEALRRSGYASDIRDDPESGERFEYRGTSSRAYEICADFHTSSNDRRAQEFGTYPGDIEHRVGRNCFERTVTEADVDSAPDFRDFEQPVREPIERPPAMSTPESPPTSVSPASAVEEY